MVVFYRRKKLCGLLGPTAPSGVSRIAVFLAFQQKVLCFLFFAFCSLLGISVGLMREEEFELTKENLLASASVQNTRIHRVFESNDVSVHSVQTN